MSDGNDEDRRIRDILSRVSTVALVGASPKPERPSHRVMGFLLSKGYRVFPVNLGQAGKEIHGQTVYAGLNEIPEPIDMVDIFRASDAVPGVVDEALGLTRRPGVIWMQLDIVHEDAARRAQQAGIEVVMDRCPAIEYPRLIYAS
ncbi:CoA-binding protein [Martelella mediterranea]|uniref:CoA-binding domain-containing protein n=1 Tax=Martelella mediterranea TaxID=293089 RepID=A0A4R3NJX2_9HYPH|nr:CoA-binding protein [Martelella mediterranea]TCT34610.1 hypothetical protein EDC90_10333 [Martelella mediterranea]